MRSMARGLMHGSRGAGLLRIGLCALAGALAGAAAAQTLPAPDYGEVAKIFVARCVVCHSGEAAPLALRLDSHAGVMKGSARGPVVKPGAAPASELVRRLRGTSTPRMPLTGPPWLSDVEVAAIERWITAGAAAGAAAPAPAPAAPRSAAEPVTFAQVAPLLIGRCAKCHTDNGLLGPPPEGYRLVSHAAALDARERARVVPGNPGASELLRRVRGLSSPRMPLDGPPYLSDADTRLLERWIAQGARDENGNPAPVPTGAAVRLRGVLSGASELDGMPLDLRGARVDRALAPGMRAELRATVSNDGSLRVTRLRAR